MTRYFLVDGRNIPVTVIEAGPCPVTQVKTSASNGYSAVQIGYGRIPPRRSTIPLMGHDARAGVVPQRFHREIRLKDDAAAAAYQPGQRLDVSVFEGVMYVDVIGTSKGKGFQGHMKRHGFKGQPASHGCERKHRSSGSIGSHAANRGKGPIKKGKRMAGHMGAGRVTTRNLDVVAIDRARNLLMVKGPIPGPIQGMVLIREATRLGRSKARKASEKA
jgi:large subunit ribosomal protein L3